MYIPSTKREMNVYLVINKGKLVNHTYHLIRKEDEPSKANMKSSNRLGTHTSCGKNAQEECHLKKDDGM
jgi:hypothetical protein